MASAESLKVRASRPRGGGILAAETIMATQPEEGYPTDPADPFAAAKPIDWSRHPVDSPLQGVPIPGSEQTPYPADLLAYRRALEPDPAASFTGGLIPAKTTPTYDPIYGAPQEPRTEFGLPTVLSEVGRGFLDMFAGKTVDPLTVVPMLGAPQAIGVATKAIPQGSLGIFGGRNAENLSPQMADDYVRATKMLDDGASSDEVYKATGKVAIERTDIDPRELRQAPRSERFVVRHHIPDNEMTLDEDVFLNLRLSVGSGDQFSLDSLISHPKLFEAYPSMRDVKVTVGTRSEMEGAIASWDEANNLIRIREDQVLGSTEDILSGSKKTKENTVKNILHEASHAVQGKEVSATYAPGTKGPMVLRESKAKDWLKGASPSNEYRQLIKNRGKSFPETFIKAKQKRDELIDDINSDWADLQLDNIISDNAFYIKDLDGETVRVTLDMERSFQRRRLKDKLEKLAGGRTTKSTEAFFPLHKRKTDVMSDAEYDNYAKQRTDFERTSQEFNDVQSKVREQIELQQLIDKSMYEYLQNRGETEARITELMKDFGPDDPTNPQYQFNKVFEQMAEATEGLEPYPSIPVTKPGLPGPPDPTGGLFSAQHMDLMADMLSPRGNTAFGLGKMKTPKGKNKGGYVMTGAETMMGLD
jgi:ribosomal protein S16